MVAVHLEEHGWKILNRNFRGGRSEIDLVAMRDGVVAFVEVRARRRVDFGHPFETIGPRKRAAIQMAAQKWIADYGSPEFIYRFDAAAVTGKPGGGAAIEILADAWSG